MKYSVNKTILNKIGVTETHVKHWLEKGLKMSYPMLQNKKYYKSEDGFAFVENGDKYVVPLAQEEILLYTENPNIFKNDFLNNVKLYISFVNWLHTLQPETSFLDPKDNLASLLVILYLFQRGMDHHYYHFDRYLVYQNYPDTPVGYWWAKLIKVSKKISELKNIDSNIVFLELLTKDDEIPVKYESILNAEEFKELYQALSKIRIFEDCQEAEAKLIVDLKKNENIFFRTAIPIWNILTQLLKKYPEMTKQGYQSKILKIMEGHPLIVTRIILSPKGLHYFHHDILDEFENEIQRWI